MAGLIDLLFGPLVGLECQRALSRRWLLIVRLIVGAAAALLVLLMGFSGVVATAVNSQFRPQGLVAGAMLVICYVAVVIAMVLSPALLAGTLAGEKSRGTMTLLLTTQVTAREIVSARFLGRQLVVGGLLLGGLPPLMALAGANSMGLGNVGTLICIPMAIAVGTGGLSLAASSMTRSGRDALMGMYLIIFIAILAPMILRVTTPLGNEPWFRWVDAVSPFSGIFELCFFEAPDGARRMILLWLAAGATGLGWATWRLRPSHLHQTSRRRRPKWFRRFRRVPPIKDNPMWWKEIHAENVGALNRFVRLFGLAIVVLLLGGSLLMAGIVGWGHWFTSDPAWTQLADVVMAKFEFFVWVTALPVSWLVQWAIGLRAAVAIASERERSTWDALVASPLDGREIVIAKIGGSMYSMKGLLLAAAVIWIAPTMVGALGIGEFVCLSANALAISAFIAVIGVWCSLASSTTNAAMTNTLVGWLVGAITLLPLSAALTAILGMAVSTAYQAYRASMGLPVANSPPSFSFLARWAICNAVLNGLFALAIATFLRRRFDALAGRAKSHPMAVPPDFRPPVRTLQAEIVEPPTAVPAARALPPSVRKPPRHDGTDKARDFWQ